MGFFDRIAGTLDDLVTGDDESSEARAREEIELARGFAARGDLGEAEARLAEIERRHPRLAALFVARGELAERRQDDDAAAAAFGRAVDLAPGDPGAWLSLGLVLARLQRFEPARDALRRALSLGRGGALEPRRRALAEGTLGRLYARVGQLGKAVRELRKAAEALPDDAEIVAALGRALVASGEAEGADWLARAARLPGGDARLLIEAAVSRPEGPAVERLLDEALARSPDDAVVRVARARHFLARAARPPDGAAAEAAEADRRQALAAAEMATVMAPTWPGGWRALADARAASGDFGGALAALRREASLGGAPPFSVWLGLALGAGDPAAVEEALAHGTPADEGFAEAKLFVAPREVGGLDRARLAVLARLAPTVAGRRFVVRAFAPSEAPAGNVVALLAWAARLCEREPRLLPLAVPMARAAEAFDRPLLVAVMGEFNAGKSSLVNALAGDTVAPVGVTPTTATINVLRYGTPGGRVSYHDGTTRELGVASVGPFLAGLGDREAATIRQVEVFAPLEALRRVEIVDTPGLNSLRPEHERVAREFLVEADALVWVFAAGQAAKASEREALQMARAAGKHVLGVVNKIDRAAPDEVVGVLRHVESTLGDLIEGAVPLSAQAALAARRGGDQAAEAQSGLVALEARLDQTFFARARDLKRATALAALRRFFGEARAAVTSDAPAPVPAAITASEPAELPPVLGRSTAGATGIAARRSALAAAGERLVSALAAERVTLRARLQEGFRLAASEVRDLVQPRAWPFGEHRADPADEDFLAELLEDATTRATAATRVRLRAAIDGVGPDPDGEYARGAGTVGGASAPAPAAGGPAFAAAPPPPPPPPRAAELKEAIEDAIERFRAYARGITEGAATVFFRVDLPRIRLDLGAIHAALGRSAPDPEEMLFRTIERAAAAIAGRAEADLAADDRAREIDALIEEEHVRAPLGSLDRALAALEAEEGAGTGR